MWSRIQQSKSSIFLFVFLGIELLNLILWKQTAMGFILLIIFFVFIARTLGSLLRPSESPAVQGWTGLWIGISAISVLGSVMYYAHSFTLEAALTLLFLIPIVCLSLWRRFGKPLHWWSYMHATWKEHHHSAGWSLLLTALALVCLYITATTLQNSATIEAIRSPWLLTPTTIFGSMGLAFFFLFSGLFIGKSKAALLPLACLALFVFLSVALLVFPLGYGFDGFIHKTTETYLAQFGSISPKPFYYAGQYALVLFVHHAFGLPIKAVDSMLLPLLAALLIPFAWHTSASHLLKNGRAALATLAGMFLLPLATFIATTPQGLANVWLLVLVLACIPFLAHKKSLPLWIGIPVLSVISIHPLSGIPALVFFIMAFAWSRGWRAMFWASVTLGSVLLPAAFLANAWISKTPTGFSFASFQWSTLFESLSLIPFWDTRFNPTLDFAYLFSQNAGLFLLLMVWLVLWFKKKERSIITPSVIFSLVLVVSFILLRFGISFSFLIDYERADYANRLLPMITFALAPALILGLGVIAERLEKQPRILRVSAIVLLASFALSTWYFTFPRHDAYMVGHGFNVSASDFEAVRHVQKLADGKPYIALANQTISAAALSVLGFEYIGDQFRYPIPTGGELYQSFLEMNKRPNRDTAKDARDFALSRCMMNPLCKDGSLSRVYFLVNDYWTDASRVRETAKASADAFTITGDGKVAIFEYRF